MDSTVKVSDADLLPPEEDWVTKALSTGISEHEGRNVMAAKLAGYFLGTGLFEPVVLQILTQWNSLNAPPLSPKELKRTIASIAKKDKLKRISTGQETPEDIIDPNLPWEEQRQAALQGLGERLGLPLTDIRITKSDESVFEFFLGEADSVVIPAKLLGHQHLFKDRFLEAGLIVPKKLKEPKEGGVWDEVVRQMISLAVLQDVGQESSAMGNCGNLSMSVWRVTGPSIITQPTTPSRVMWPSLSSSAKTSRQNSIAGSPRSLWKPGTRVQDSQETHRPLAQPGA